MITLVASALLAAPLAFETIALSASDDAWVYPHASEGGTDLFLRVWGSGGRSVAPTAADAENFSYSYLKFSTEKLPVGKTLESATLILKPSGKPELAANRKEFPMEVRPLKGAFKESNWVYDNISSTYPSLDEVFGKGIIELKDPAAAEADRQYELRIELTGEKSKFKEAVAKAVADKAGISLALVSLVDPAEQGRGGVFKVYSNNNTDENLKPTLILRYN